MILEYYRPKVLEEALTLVARPDPVTVPLGGGTVLSQPGGDPVAVVDLQDLGLDKISEQGTNLGIGATVRLAELMDYFGNAHPLFDVIRLEAGHNIRQSATMAGALISGDGRSPLCSAFLALNASLRILPADEEVALGNLIGARGESLKGKLIAEVLIAKNISLSYDYVARSPADRPIVAVAVATWRSGRTRVVLGGYGEYPILAFDGPERDGAGDAAKNAYSHAGDAWATAEYRRETAKILVERAL